MTEHRIGTQEEWQAERDALLKEEKELTRRNDELLNEDLFTGGLTDTGFRSERKSPRRRDFPIPGRRG